MVRLICTVFASLMAFGVHSQQNVPSGDPLQGIDPDCEGGSCPMPSPEAVGASSNDSCGIWLGPSPIKKAEDHGFGLGVFTGKAIPKGTAVESLYEGSEVLIPIYGSDSIYDEHPPLREYVWDEDSMPEVAIEYPIDLTALFIPGLASIAPCTSENYNLVLHGTGRYGDTRTSLLTHHNLHRSTHPAAGAIAYRNNVTYVAVRDIAPGEELVVECSDDNFDGGAYFLARYNDADDAVACLDQYVRVQAVPDMGKGLFAKRSIPANQVILSTPMAPIHRREMDIHDENVNSKQLLLNYCYSHPESDLLWLPFGPAVNFLNHNDTPNAEIRWHDANPDAPRRQQHHNADLLTWPADAVTTAHGRTLTADLVALREIAPGEQVVIDYGPAWRQAWADHQASWRDGKSKDDADYISADHFHRSQGGIVRTVKEQGNLPYPDNMETFCYYMNHNDLAEGGEPSDEILHFDWLHETEHTCLRPCVVLDRHHDQGEHPTYTVRFSQEDNIRIIEHCVIYAEYVVSHVPHSAIRVVDRPYTTDVFMKNAFRHEIGVPDGMYPSNWMRKKLRKTVSMGTPEDADFIRKTKRE